MQTAKRGQLWWHQKDIDKWIQELENLQSVINEQYTTMDELAQAFYDENGNVRANVAEDEARYKEAPKASMDYFNAVGDGESSLVESFNTIMSKAQFADMKEQLIAASEEGAAAVRPLINDTLALSEAFEEAGLSVDELVQHIMALGNPNALNLKEVKQQLAEAFSGEPK